MTDHGHYFAVYSQTGVHIGLWQDGKFAAEVQSEHPGNTITELVRADTHQTALDDLEKARAEVARLREAREAVEAAYDELLATVRGECPSLVNEDSGASQVLINLMIEAESARAALTPAQEGA